MAAASPAGNTMSVMQARAMQEQEVHSALLGLQFSMSSEATARHIQHAVKAMNGGMDKLKEATDGFIEEYPEYITKAITDHTASSDYNPDLPIILTFDQYSLTSDPRVFDKDDYVIVFTNNVATPINTSAEPGIYRVDTVHHDNTLTVAPASISANHLNTPKIHKTKCALLRKHIVNTKTCLIIMMLEYNPSSGGAKSSRRRKRRPSRSKSVNKKRNYTQQRVRRRSHRR